MDFIPGGGQFGGTRCRWLYWVGIALLIACEFGAETGRSLPAALCLGFPFLSLSTDTQHHFLAGGEAAVQGDEQQPNLEA